MNTLRRLIESLVVWVRRVVTQPRAELDRWQRAARFAYDLCRYGGRQLQQDRAPQMAAALAYRMLFALVPVLIVSMIVVKSMKGTEAILVLAQELFASLNLDQVQIVRPDEVAMEPSKATTLAEWLIGLVRQAASVDLTAVGWAGVALIGYAAIGLMVTIENSFNAIYRAPEGRRWTRRVPLYWFVLTMSPVAIGATWYLNSQVGQWIASMQTGQTWLIVARMAWSFLVGWLVLLAVYTLLPNRTIGLRPAAIGALVAALLLDLGNRTLDAYMSNAFAVSQLYGSLGLLPLFMFWVYLMWLAVLFGLEVSATLEALEGRELEDLESQPAPTGMFDPAAVVTVMEVVAERFAAGGRTSARDIAEATALPERTVSLVLDRLAEKQIVHWLDGEVRTVSLARPPEQVTADELIEIGYQLVDASGLGQRSSLVKGLRAAQRQLAERTTLASLVAAER